MSTFDSTKLPLQQILADITTGKTQLPDFQRGWVWDDEHIKSLLVSIAQSFPVGAVMMLDTGGEIRFQVRPIEGVKFDRESPEPEHLILDGQQRLTSLTQVLSLENPVRTFDHKGGEILRYYYIVSVRKFRIIPNTGDSRDILPHNIIYGVIQVFVSHERFGAILHEDCVFMDPIRGFHAQVRPKAFIFVRKNTFKNPSYAL